MTTLVLTADAPPRARSVTVWALAWRNLWRNRRRTWLTAGGIAFAVWLLVFSVSMQDGSFEVMVDNAARLYTGHVQLQHPGYHDDPRLEYTLHDTAELEARVRAVAPTAAVLPRAQGFALVSAGERSFGGQVMGVDPARERGASSLPGMGDEGRYLGARGEAFVGSALARNLGVSVGQELVLLGTARQGGVAAAVVTVVGTFTSSQPELDRSLLQIHIDDFRDAWNLESDAVHSLVLLLDRAFASEAVAAALQGNGHVALDWRELLPEFEQTIQLKRVSTQLFFAFVAVIVSFSVVNTFMMTVFERKAEFGMLMALGMRPGAIFRQLCVEALWIALVGVALGLGVSIGLVALLTVTGVPLPADAAQIMARYNMPDRMYPEFSTWAAAVAALVMVLGTQVAVLVPALRVRRLRPVEALRAPE